MHAHPPLAITPPSLLTIVSPDYEQDYGAIPYNHILSLAQAVKEEEQLAAPAAHDVDRDSLNTTPDMYEHTHHNSYMPSHYQHLNPPLSPLSSADAVAPGYDGGRLPSLSPSPVNEQAPHYAAISLPPPPMAQPRSAPHNQLHFSNPFATGAATLQAPGTLGYQYQPDRRLSEPALLSNSSSLVEPNSVFLGSSTRYGAGVNVRHKDFPASPAPSSSSNSGAPWTPPPVIVGSDPEAHGLSAVASSRGPPHGAHNEPTTVAKAEASSPSLGHAMQSHYESQDSAVPFSTNTLGYDQAQRAPYLRSEQHGAASSVGAPHSAPQVPRSHPGTDAALLPQDGGHDGLSSPEHSSSKTYSFVPLPGNAVRKRPRRRYDEIERLYRCSFISPGK
jgi:hypothetical protein